MFAYRVLKGVVVGLALLALTLGLMTMDRDLPGQPPVPADQPPVEDPQLPGK